MDGLAPESSLVAAPAPVDPAFAFPVAAGSSWITIRWNPPAGTARIQITRDGRLIDAFPSKGAPTYTDHLLWPGTTYSYTVVARDRARHPIGTATVTAATASSGSTVRRFYSKSSFWNVPIGPNAPLDPDSARMIASSILPWRDHTVIDNDDQWGIPLAYAGRHSKRYRIGCVKFDCGTQVSFRIPRYAQPSTGSDGHLAVYDPRTNRELDMWQAVYDPASDTWTAGSRSVTPARWGAACGLGQHCGGGGVAAGFDEWGGVIRPEEIAQGHIDHALVISMPHVRADYLACPATNNWAPQGDRYAHDPDALPLGARIRLSPSFDVAAQPWPGWEKVVAVALQQYGAYVTDLDANITLRGEPNLDRGYDAWAKVGMSSDKHPSLTNLPWDRFQVLTLQPC